MAQHGQRLTVARWPRRRAHHGGATGHEEEGFAPWIPSEISRPQLARWMHKKKTELELDLAMTVEHYRDGASSSEMSKADGKTEQGKKKNDDCSKAL